MNPADFRIISLLPGATELVVALGLGDSLVGRSHECDYPREVQKLPVCTEAKLNSEQSSAKIDADVTELTKSALSIYKVKIEVLQELKPTHILTQDQCDVCAVSLADVEKALSQLTESKPKVISLQPDVLSDLWKDIEQVASIFQIDSQPLVNYLQARVETCYQKTQIFTDNNDIPTVAAIEWVDPLMATGNWIPELIEIAGGKSLFGVTGKHSPYLKWEAILETDPEYIIIMPCGFDLERTRQESQVLKQQPNWENLQAVKNGKVFITDGNAYFNRPSPRLVDSLEILAEILHPDAYNYGYKDQAWAVF